MLFVIHTMAFSVCRAAAEPPRPIAQQRINEMAAALLRAHRALIEEPGLRHEGERLEAYLERAAAPLPGESGVRYRVREGAYVAALERVAAAENLCTAIPSLHDNSLPNVTLWQHAVKASSLLPTRAAHVRVAWTDCRRAGAEHADTHRLGIEMAQTILWIKTAYDALREARP
jgi:hypothetical protein